MHTFSVSAAKSEPNAAAIWQDTYLSPGQATRLHTLSSGIPLPGSDSDEDQQAHAAGHDIHRSPQQALPDSAAEPVQSSAEGSGSGDESDDEDNASSISGMSGVSSVAPTEVVDDEDATIVLGNTPTGLQELTEILHILRVLKDDLH